MSKECLVPRLAGIALLLMSCQPVLSGEVTPTASPTPEPTPQQSPLDRPQTILERLREESTLQYAKLHKDRMDLKGGSGKTYTLAGPLYLSQAIVLMEGGHNSVCGFAGDEELEAYQQVREDFEKSKYVDRRFIDRAFGKKLKSCSPFMKKY
ncbi:MAG: hypothetical protein Q8P92_05740 [Candidatus Daviesbacteria bacterium]|nr:hypothetical protein [Candidatus Daviesbacteria bacterium]